MVDNLKKALLAGLGSAAYTYEKATKIIDEMVEKGKITVEDGKELSVELKSTLHEKSEKFKPLTKEEFIEILNDTNFATKEDIEEIKDRLAKLEAKLL